MKIETTVDEQAALLSPEGLWDREASAAINAAVAALGAQVTDLVLDMKRVEGVTSVGLSCVAALDREMRKRGSLTFIYVPDVVMETFVTTGLVKRLNIIL